MKLARLEVLSADEIRQIHEATVHILSECGVRLHSARLRQLLKARGLTVDESTGVARFPRQCLEDALSRIPSRFEVFNRDGEAAFTLGDGQPRIAAGHNAVFWVDSETGETRPSRVVDVEQFARICEQLPVIDMLGIPVMPQDVTPARSSLLHAVRACVTNSRKPIYFSTDQAGINRGCIELLRAAGKGDLATQPYGISQLSPTSPLYWEENVLEAVMETVETGVPLAILPEPNAGVSAPYTLAGLLIMNNAECLSGLAMIQMLRPGHKVLYANSWTTTEMRTGAALVGSVETTLCRIAAAQLARFYHVPSHTTAPNSDNHAHDEQNSWEKTLSLFCSVASQHDLIVNCGMFATGMTCSHEQLLMDEEIAAMSRRIASGIAVTPETMARDAIEEIGPQGGSYLTVEHTMNWLRRDEYLIPRLAVRGPLASWQAAGSKDTYALARERAKPMRQVPAPALDPGRGRRLNEIVEQFSRQ